MADFFFFTDPEVMETQDVVDAFGVIDKNNYKIDSMHSASGTAKAYAVTAGQILVQDIKDNSELVNIVLKPTEQPNLNLPLIEYIIYKGVLKSSLVAGTKVAPAATNGFTQQIYAELTQNYADKEEPIPDSLPLAGDVLGLDYAANATVDTYKLSDDDALSKAFYNSDADQTTLRSVKAGTHIGTFSNTKFGILVSFEKIGYEPTFKLARELDSNIEVDETTDSLSIAEKFKIKHEKEEVHNFIDPVAFFGAFSHLGLNSNGIKTGDTLYNEVVTKFANKNKIYVDLRNEYDDSYNYYENYGNFVYWYAGDQEAFEQKNYYGETEWPVLAVDEAELPEDKTLKLGFPKGDNDYPLIFLKRGFLETLGVEELPEDDECYLGGAIDDNAIVSFSDKLKIPTTTTGNTFSNYFQLKYIKRYTTSESQYLGYSLKKESYLDNLFPIFDMQVPFTNTLGTIAIKTFDESAYVDKSNINEDDFFVKTGIAIDQEAFNFIAYPQHYSNDETQTTEILPLAGKESFEGITFLDDFDKHFSNFGIQKQNFATKETNLEYLTLNGGSGLTSVVEGQLVVEEALSIPSPSIGKVYDYENINIFSLTHEQYEAIRVIQETEFTAPYKVYLGIGNINRLAANETGFTTVELVLRGLKEKEDGTITTNEKNIDVTVFAEDALFNWDKTIIDFTKLNNEERINLIDNYIDNDVTSNKYLYEELGSELKKIVDDFDVEIKTLNEENFEEELLSIILEKGKSLLDRARTDIRISSNKIFGKDGVLYIARLQMRKCLKELDLWKKVSISVSDFSKYLDDLERITRGLHITNIPDFSTHPDHIPILITGYDPFSGLRDSEFHSSNSSGNLALALDNEEIIYEGKKAIIKSVVFPVRYKEFNDGWIEQFFNKYIKSSSIQKVKMIITFSYGGVDTANGKAFKIDRFASRYRNESLTDNDQQVAGGIEYLQRIVGNEFLETTLPFDEMYIADGGMDLHEKAQFSILKSGISLGNKTIGKKVSTPPYDTTIIKLPSKENYNPYNGIQIDNIDPIAGSGGSFLSNEIFYRVSYLRSLNNPTLSTGHIHMGFLKGDEYMANSTKEGRTKMLEIITESIQKTLETL